jgi:predicted secreted protein
MGWPLDVALYIIVWWLIFFAVLPWGVRPANEGEKGFDAGAPANPRLLLKAVVTSLVAAVLAYGIHAALVVELAKLRTAAYG